ncbi:hypothetical protein J6590_031104 [Homalodisca vitripennis]|nr:hypothetical protein J6590_031104 [Homalodisca vitripennis]
MCPLSLLDTGVVDLTNRQKRTVIVLSVVIKGIRGEASGSNLARECLLGNTSEHKGAAFSGRHAGHESGNGTPQGAVLRCWVLSFMVVNSDCVSCRSRRVDSTRRDGRRVDYYP